MSVIVLGMEMPENCIDCYFMDDVDCCAATAIDEPRKRKRIAPDDEQDSGDWPNFLAERMPWCPLRYSKKE